MPDERQTAGKGKKDLKIRDLDVSVHDALDRMSRRLGMPREAFTRILLRRAAWKAPTLFEMELREVLGPEPEQEEIEEK
jgi:hypothetical protein